LRPSAASLLFLLVCFGVVFSSSGCLLAPAIESFNKLGVTEADRQALLAERFKKFSDALYWGEPGEAIAFVAPKSREALEPDFRSIRKSEKIVDSHVESVGFSDNAYKAKVDVMVKSYKIPFYVVNERNETQDWEFTIKSGWLLVSRSETKEG
jgi:hypothetical protein